MITKKDIIILISTLVLAFVMAVINNLRLPEEQQLDWIGSPQILEKPPEMEGEL